MKSRYDDQPVKLQVVSNVDNFDNPGATRTDDIVCKNVSNDEKYERVTSFHRIFDHFRTDKGQTVQ